MIERVEKAFRAHADQIAYRTRDCKLTFRELWDLASGYAHSLAGSSDPVLVIGDKEPHMVAGMLACLMVSRPYVPCDGSVPRERVQKIQQLTGAKTVIHHQTRPNAQKWTAFTYDDKAIVYYICTSGSTGEPKAVPICARNLNAFLDMLLQLDALQDMRGKIILNQARFAFDLSVADLYFSWCTGTELFAISGAEQQDYAALANALRSSHASAAVMTPTFAKYCLCFPEFCRKNMPQLHCVFFCGETLEHSTVRKLMDRFDGIRILNAYGPTEATCAVCASEITAPMLSQDVLPCGEISGASCAVRIEGEEIVLCGDSVFSGYAGSQEKVTLYKTGDRGRIVNGQLYCLGRLYGYVKYKGHRVDLQEIQKKIASLENVEQCAVKCVRSPEGIVTAIRADVVTTAWTADQIRAFLLQHLPAYMVPKTIRIRQKMEWNLNGKQAL